MAVSCEDFWNRLSPALQTSDHDFLADKMTDEPIYRTATTKKKGNPRRLPKSERKKNQSLNRLIKKRDD
jgi:hypothetical protein